VWELLADGLSRDDVLARLTETFAVDPEVARASVLRLTAELQREGLLTS
jgi:hypothetical protein